MKILADPGHVLARGLDTLRTEMQLPAGFPPEVLAAAQAAVARAPDAHVDRTGMPFVTLDPAGSTDLDQAFAIDESGSDLILHYAIADVAWFVREGDPLDQEAWTRGTTQYLPDGRVSLYPPLLSEGAASLLPEGPRPCVLFTVRLDPAGVPRLDGVARALIRSRAKLAYDHVRPADLPSGFEEFARRMTAAEQRRGATRIDVPEQEVEQDAQGRFDLRFRPRNVAEDRNAALSLACNMAVATALHDHRTGLFRVMAGPDDRDIDRLRNVARAYGLVWPHGATLTQFERLLDPQDPRQAAFAQAIHRSGSGARYQPFTDGVIPWHAAMAAPYAHATAPLRRLADRYVVQAALAIANGQSVPESVTAAFERLPKVMARAESLGGRIEHAVIDLAEAVMLKDRVGERFDAVVTDTDQRGARIQLCRAPVVAQLPVDGLVPGDEIVTRLVAADPVARRIEFALDRGGAAQAGAA